MPPGAAQLRGRGATLAGPGLPHRLRHGPALYAATEGLHEADQRLEAGGRGGARANGRADAHGDACGVSLELWIFRGHGNLFIYQARQGLAWSQ